MKKIILLFTMIVYFAIGAFQASALSPVACTQELKMCPDGKTWVGRESPTCEFKECPNTKICPVPSPPYCDGNGYIKIGLKDINGCKLPQYECKEPALCTKEYMPVCAQPPMPTCPEGVSCIQVLPEKKTYGNTCEMKAAGAKFLYEGKCAVPEDEVCPVASPPYCEGNGYTITEYTQIGNCKIPQFQCKKGEWTEISEENKAKIDSRIEKFEEMLNERSDDNEVKRAYIEKIIDKLEVLKGNTNSEKLQLLIRYIIFKVEELKNSYSEENLENILDFLK